MVVFPVQSQFLMLFVLVIGTWSTTTFQDTLKTTFTVWEGREEQGEFLVLCC